MPCNYHLPKKRGFINYEVMTSNLNFDVRLILQLFVIALCAVSQPINRKMVLHLSLRLKSYLQFFFYDNHSCLLLMKGKLCGS